MRLCFPRCDRLFFLICYDSRICYYCDGGIFWDQSCCVKARIAGDVTVVEGDKNFRFFEMDFDGGPHLFVMLLQWW